MWTLTVGDTPRFSRQAVRTASRTCWPSCGRLSTLAWAEIRQEMVCGTPRPRCPSLEGACSQAERRARAPGTPSTVRRMSARSENSDMLYGPRSVAGISTCAP